MEVENLKATLKKAKQEAAEQETAAERAAAEQEIVAERAAAELTTMKTVSASTRP